MTTTTYDALYQALRRIASNAGVRYPCSWAETWAISPDVANAVIAEVERETIESATHEYPTIAAAKKVVFGRY